MTNKRGSLAGFASQKAAPSRSPADQAPTQRTRQPAPPEKRRGQTLRLSPAAWRQLKFLAVERDRPAHDLLIEAVSDLFQKYGKPPIAFK